jgi:hypothetical protein
VPDGSNLVSRFKRLLSIQKACEAKAVETADARRRAIITGLKPPVLMLSKLHRCTSSPRQW